MNLNSKQDKHFYFGLAASLVLSTVIAFVAQSVGETAAQERIANPATYRLGA